MPRITLPSFFKKKEETPLDIELKKYPKKDRSRLKELFLQWESRKVVKIEEYGKKIEEKPNEVIVKKKIEKKPLKKVVKKKKRKKYGKISK